MMILVMGHNEKGDSLGVSRRKGKEKILRGEEDVSTCTYI
jgi:hypothetical protein